MSRARTGAEAYLAGRLDDAQYRAAYEKTREHIAAVDTVVNALDAHRRALGITKAELARRSGMKPEAVRRLFSMNRPNPTLNTLSALAGVLGLEITLVALDSPAIRPAPSAAS